MKNPNDLKARYPYMFAGKGLEISIPKGWFPMFAKLCQDIDELLGEDKKNFQWVQAKEKLGAARWYYRIDGLKLGTKVRMLDEANVVTVVFDSRKGKPVATIQEMVAELIDSAESKTNTSCIVCGQAGHPDSHIGYVLVLCDQHARLRKKGGNQRLPSFWFEHDEDCL